MTLKRKIKVGISVAVFLLLAVIISGSIWQKTDGDSFFKRLGFRSYLISYTGSMEPVLKQNDLIIVKKCKFEDLKKGDIITFYGLTLSGEIIPITHTIEEIVFQDGRMYVRTKGVNLAYPDLIPVTKDGFDGTNLYIGKLAAKSRFLGNFLAFFSSAHGIITVGINVSCLIAIAIIINSGGKKCKQKEGK